MFIHTILFLRLYKFNKINKPLILNIVYLFNVIHVTVNYLNENQSLTVTFPSFSFHRIVTLFP